MCIDSPGKALLLAYINYENRSRLSHEVIKLFSYSAEHEINHAHKCLNANNCVDSKEY